MGLVSSYEQFSEVGSAFAYEKVIDEICDMPWQDISNDDVMRVALAYYYFSVQFRENLEVACNLHPDDEKLKSLYLEECNTSNLSPWNGIAEDGEAMNHDEFMRRLLVLRPMDNVSSLEREGSAYLALVRQTDDVIKAKSIASYEDGGLVRVFSAMLRAPSWRGEGQRAFRHFLEEHIRFDSCASGGHGALSRHLQADDSILPLWVAFRDILKFAVPALDGRRLKFGLERVGLGR